MTVKPGITRVIFVPPAGAIAFYYLDYQTSTGFPYTTTGSEFQSVLFPESGEIFPSCITTDPSYNTNQITQGRILAMSAEIVSTNNSFTQYGTVMAYKTDITESILPQPATTTLFQRYLTGCLALTKDTATTGSYLAPIKSGAYSVSMCRTGGSFNFPWKKVDDQFNQKTLMQGIYNSPVSGNLTSMSFRGPMVFFDDSYDSIVYRVTVPEGDIPSQGIIVKAWRSIEWSPVYASLLYTVSQQGAHRSENTMKLYGEMQRNLPVAVPSKDNPDFWNTLLDTISDVSGIASLIPGVGPIASGVHAVAGALRKNNKKSDKAPKVVNPGNKLQKQKKVNKKKKKKINGRH